VAHRHGDRLADARTTPSPPLTADELTIRSEQTATLKLRQIFGGPFAIDLGGTLSTMYLPTAFKPSDDDIRSLLGDLGAADLVTVTAKGMLATMLPFIYEPAGTRPGIGEAGALIGHLARKNEQWREPSIGEALVIVHGPDAYVTPAWYAATREHGRVVPTWNYITAHLHGRLVVHDDGAWVEALVRRLTERHEDGRADPWSVDDAPPGYLEEQLRAIVGVEVLVDRIEAKFKLSQNRSTEDVAGVITGFDELGNAPMANAVRSAARRQGPSRTATDRGNSS
jgi:transcriptional regulator